MSRNSKTSAAQQLKLVMECRKSSKTDAQWCIENGIRPATFYNWVSRLRKRGCDIPESNWNELELPVQHQDVVLLDVVPKPSALVVNDEQSALDSSNPMLLEINGAKLTIPNGADPSLLTQVILAMRGKRPIIGRLQPKNIDYIDYVYKIRKNIKFVNYRKILSNLTKEIRAGNTNEIANSQSQLEEAISDLISEFKDIKIGKYIAYIIPNCLNAFKMFTITSKIVNTSIQLCFEKDLDSYIKKKYAMRIIGGIYESEYYNKVPLLYCSVKPILIYTIFGH